MRWTKPTLIALIFGAGACTSPSAVQGAWRSDEARTHAELRKIEDQLSPGQKKALFRPGFYGQMVIVYEGDANVVVYEGECILPTQTGLSARILELMSWSDVEVDGDTMKVPNLKGSKEVFTRVNQREIEKQYPCVREGLDKLKKK